MRLLRRLSVALLSGLLAMGATGVSAQAEIRVALPPDPNALPLFVLEEHQDRFLPETELSLVPNPGGDPSAMRAMIKDGRMDFAFFNLVGGVRFLEGGLEELELVAPWVWSGIYLLSPEQRSGLSGVDDEQVLVAPGLSTPPHVVTEQALAEAGIEPRFAASGAGMALLGQARSPQRAPAGIAAPEPLISLILHRQEAEGWEQRWQIALDPAETLQDRLEGPVPLGAVWSVQGQADAGQRQALMQALEEVVAWLEETRHHEEAAQIAADGFEEFFGMPVPERALLKMLEEERVVWDPATDKQSWQAVDTYLREVFAIEPPEGVPEP